MKKIFSALKGTVLFALISINYTNGQDVASGNSKFPNATIFSATGVVNKASVPAVTANVNKRAIMDFEKVYKNKVLPVWSLMESGGYTASFAEGEMQNCVYYDKKGTWICNIKRYNESKMSREIRNIIKPVYYDYTILGISEITAPGNIVHLVYLSEDANNFKTVRICDGLMEVIEWIRNGKFVNL